MIGAGEPLEERMAGLDLDLRGVTPALVLPMTDGADPDLPSFRRYVGWVVDQGPIAVAVNADTGEGPHLTLDEQRGVIEAAADEVRGRVPIVAGITARHTREAVALARQASAAGADALLVFPIPAFQSTPLDPELAYAYHAAIADACDLPLVLFQLQPALGGALFAPEVLARLLEIPSAIALKEASFDAARFVRTRQLLRELRPIQLLTGNDTFIYESIVLGADGALIGMAAVATGAQVELVRAALAGDHQRAQRLDDALRPLFEVVFGRPPVAAYRARIKEALVLEGVIPRATVRPPLLPVADDERAAIRGALERLTATGVGS